MAMTITNPIITRFCELTKEAPSDSLCMICPQGYWSTAKENAGIAPEKCYTYAQEKGKSCTLYLLCFCKLYNRQIDFSITDCQEYQELKAEKESMKQG